MHTWQAAGRGEQGAAAPRQLACGPAGAVVAAVAVEDREAAQRRRDLYGSTKLDVIVVAS